MSWSPIATEYDPLAVGSIDGTDKEPHDMGVVRALNSEYVPQTHLSSKPDCTVFVGRLHPKVTSDELEDIFKEFGKVKRCRVVRDLVTGFSKQYGFVEFEKESQADRAYRKGHKSLIRGLEVIVDREHGRTMKGWKPRRLGGGFGGRKESGQLRFGCRDRPWRPPILPEVDDCKTTIKNRDNT
ncbi:hypothetical protein RUM44_009268 [Polyplax serrata]|uniref:RRM domain-containing protein n=1 Tax=Polyplax serrata TaxID=468196 RepID=A0ABR1AS67_POLSC